MLICWDWSPQTNLVFTLVQFAAVTQMSDFSRCRYWNWNCVSVSCNFKPLYLLLKLHDGLIYPMAPVQNEKKCFGLCILLVTLDLIKKNSRLVFHFFKKQNKKYFWKMTWKYSSKLTGSCTSNQNEVHSKTPIPSVTY